MIKEEISYIQKQKAKSWKYIKGFYPKYISKNVHFANLIKPMLSSDIEMVDLGCGRGFETEIVYKDIVKKCYGVDISDSVFRNPTISDPIVGDVCNVLLPEESVDLVVSQQVLEHIEKPIEMFNSAYRILKGGGTFLVMTPNLYYPTTLLSYLTPHRFHRFINRHLFGIEDEDVFPTFYRGNTLSALSRLGKEAGFEIIHSEYFMCNPGQFDFSPFLTRLEVAFHRFVSRNKILFPLKDIVIVVFVKPDARKL